MSSANRVRLTYIEEASYGVTPVGDFTEISFIDESLTGTPLTEESKQIRSDRQSSGQVNTGLELSGGFNFELSAEISLEHFMKQAMMKTAIVAGSNLITDLSITMLDEVSGTLTAGGGDFITAGVQLGSLCVMKNWDTVGNNTVIQVTALAAGLISFESEGVVNETKATATVQMMPYYDIGTDDVSDTICKEFLDVADANTRSITYSGERVGEMKLNFAFGKIVEGSFSLAGNGYSLPIAPINDGRTIIPVGSEQQLDASNGFGWLLVDNNNVDICLESLELTMNNNLKPSNCIGELAPKDQVVGSANLTFSSKMHLSINSWDLFMQAKLDQSPISLAFFTRDFNDRGYGVVIDRAQINFPDPNAAGKDETVVMDVAGTASYDETTLGTMKLFVLS